MPGVTRPVLWHLRDSHFNEKVRWALDLKRVPHARRAPLPGSHMLAALALTGRPTLPILVLDGRPIRDSTAIITTLDARWPEPSLAPADGDGQRRAADIDALCGEVLGPCLRRFSLFHLLRDARLCAAMIAPDAGSLTRGALMATLPGLRRLLFARYRITPESAAEARARAVRVLDQLEADIGPRGYLVGGKFTASDLTVAAMLGPLLRPAGSPWAPLPWLPPAVEELKTQVTQRPIGRWALDMYDRHRTPTCPESSGS